MTAELARSLSKCVTFIEFMLSHACMHFASVEDSGFRKFSIKFASGYAMRKILDQAENEQQSRLLRLYMNLHNEPTSASFCGQLFEYFAHRQLSAGGYNYSLRSLDHPEQLIAVWSIEPGRRRQVLKL